MNTRVGKGEGLYMFLELLIQGWGRVRIMMAMVAVECNSVFLSKIS